MELTQKEREFMRTMLDACEASTDNGTVVKSLKEKLGIINIKERYGAARYFYISIDGNVYAASEDMDIGDDSVFNHGNYFTTIEWTEKEVEAVRDRIHLLLEWEHYRKHFGEGKYIPIRTGDATDCHYHGQGDNSFFKGSTPDAACLFAKNFKW